MKRTALILVLLAFSCPAFAGQNDHAVLFREDFKTLDDWKPYTFPYPKIRKHTIYSIEKHGSGKSCLRAESDDAASAIYRVAPFNVAEYPKARWRWKVSNVYQKGDSRTKAGDDYPIRIYVMFEYDPEQAGVGERLLYGLAKARFGEYPPQASLCYVWASREEKDRILTSPYTDRVKMVLLRMGTKDVGTWQDEEVNILEDYRKAFATEPPSRARIAIMNDSDNTHESAVSWVDYIEVFR